MLHSSSQLGYRILFSVFLIAIGLSFVECKKWTQKNTDTQISTHGDNEGHKKGQNCMNCHYTEGNGDGAFSIGGSIYGNVGDGMLYLYTDWTSPAIDSVEIDADGNVYTTEPVDFSNGLHVALRSGSGTLRYMNEKITNGQCNLCHGVTEEKISF